MNHKFLNYFAGVVVIHAKGRKIDRFLSYLYKLKISLLKIEYVDRQNIIVKIYNNDLEKVINMKTTYDINVVGYEGKLRVKEGIKKHLFLLLVKK